MLNSYLELFWQRYHKFEFLMAVLYYRSWWDWSGIGVGWVPTLPSQTPTIHPWQFFWLIIVSVPKINAISFNIKTSMVGLGGMEWDWVGWMSHNVFCKIWYSRKCSFGPHSESVSAWVYSQISFHLWRLGFGGMNDWYWS